MTFFMGGPSPHSTYEHMNRSNSNYQPRQPTYQPTTPRDIQPSQSSPGEEANRNGRSMIDVYSAQSHLSSYGNNSLAFNEREIFDKQNSKFNIISLKPKEVPDKIKQYPKFSLENKDSCYYQKMQLMREQEMASRSSRQSSPSRNEPVVAGKHTYVPEENKNPSYYQHGRYFTPRMLNHADEVSNIMWFYSPSLSIYLTINIIEDVLKEPIKIGLRIFVCVVTVINICILFQATNLNAENQTQVQWQIQGR